MAQQKQQRGVIYVATGERYAHEVIISARSLRHQMPRLPITIFTNESLSDTSIFNRVEPVPANFSPKVVKIACLLRTPYKHTLYLDVDTFVYTTFPELFKLLDRFDVAAATSPQRIKRPTRRIPNCFPEMNAGVILYKLSKGTQNLLREWQRLYERQGKRAGAQDEPPFRQALYESKIQLAPLPPEYNCRIAYPNCVNGIVKIVHGRSDNLEQIAHDINQREDYRTYIPEQGLL